MNKQKGIQLTINTVLLIAVGVLLAYSAYLTYVMLTFASASESADASLAKQIADLSAKK